MTKKIKDLTDKILKTRRKLLKACVERDEERMIKYQHKLLRLNLARKSN